MKLHILGLFTLFYAHCVRPEILNGAVEEQSVKESGPAEDIKQLSELVVPNEHSDDKRSHILKLDYDEDEDEDAMDADYPSKERIIFPSKKTTLPNFISSILERPEPSEVPGENPFMTAMTNIKSEPLDRPFPIPLTPIEPPKYVFSGMHMKLIPKSEESREDAMLENIKSRQGSLLENLKSREGSVLENIKSQIQGEIMGLPEIIRDAPNPSSLESELRNNNNRPSGLIHIINTFGRPLPHNTLPKLEEPVIIDSPERSSFEEEPSFPSILIRKPPTSSNYATDNGAINSASKTTKKPMVKIDLKSKLRITRPKTSSTSKRPARWNSIHLIKPNASTKSKNQSKADKPRCPSGSEFVNGTKEMWNGFHKAESWSKSFGALAESTKKATKSVGSCLKSVWRSITGLFGFGDDDDANEHKQTSRKRETNESMDAEETTTTEQSKPVVTTEKSKPVERTTLKPANSTTPKPTGKIKGLLSEAKKGFEKHVAKPVANFFTDLAQKTKEAFSKREDLEEDGSDEGILDMF